MGYKPLKRYALSWFISHNRLVTFFNYHLKYLKHDDGLPQELTILTCLTNEYYYTDHSYSIWISGVFNMTQLSQSHESAMPVCRVELYGEQIPMHSTPIDLMLLCMR